MKRFLLFLLAFSMLFGCTYLPISAEEDIIPIMEEQKGVSDLGIDEGSLNLNCHSAVLMEATTGCVLYVQNPNEALPPASVTKIMTLLLIMEAIDSGKLKMTDTVTVSANAASMGGSQIFLKEGEQMPVVDMLKSVVIASANDAAVALAEHLCGSVDSFVSRMNEKAKSLGMNDTTFENVTGLDDTAQHHLTSAKDIAIMSRELIQHKTILEYSSIWMDTIRNGEFGLTNTTRTGYHCNYFLYSRIGIQLSQQAFCLAISAGRTAARRAITATRTHNSISLVFNLFLL